MGWETRGNSLYYYTAKRIGGRVVKEYHGTGIVAELAARYDKSTRDQRNIDAELERIEREELAELDDILAPLHELADAATVAALLAAGCHRPKRGTWRKRRV